jgi:hypothetical protein
MPSSTARPEVLYRQVFVFIDGTNNSPITGQTNVQRLYGLLARNDEQITYYQPGVGTLEPVGAIGGVWRRTLTFVDKTTAFMMKRHVCSAYEFLSETVLDDDDVHLFGFSRGAFTARVLAGMIASVGILHPGMREMTNFAWKAYMLADNGEQGRKRLEKFKAVYSRNMRIRFLGLWDTVSSAGFPWAPAHYPLADSNLQIQCVAHAISVDERRVGFEARRWGERDEMNQVLNEFWFPGAHSDVGGGYADSESMLASISLAWMIERLPRRAKIKWRWGTSVDEPVLGLDVEEATRVAAAQATHDESQKWRWKWLEYLPLPRWRLDRTGAGKPKLSLRPHHRERRSIGADERIHESVRILMSLNDKYRPTNAMESLEERKRLETSESQA